MQNKEPQKDIEGNKQEKEEEKLKDEKISEYGSIISSASSIPTDIRIKSGVTPAFMSCSSVSWRWVVLADESKSTVNERSGFNPFPK